MAPAGSDEWMDLVKHHQVALDHLSLLLSAGLERTFKQIQTVTKTHIWSRSNNVFMCPKLNPGSDGDLAFSSGDLSH